MNKRQIEILKRISNGEDSYTQFKSQVSTSKDLSKEMVAFSNSEGGVLLFGVADNGDILGLDITEIEQLGQLIGNVANENIKPPIYPITNNIDINGKVIIIVSIKKGLAKPYMTSNGEFYIKSSSDKKKVSPEELKILFSEGKGFYADEEPLIRTDISDLNHELFHKFLYNDDENIFEALKGQELKLKTVLNNYGIMLENHLTLTGNLIFGLLPQKYCPSFYVDCVCFNGNDVSCNEYLSEERIKGTLGFLYDGAVRFIRSLLSKRQRNKDFNSNGVLEVDERIILECVTNSLIHRDYYINAPIKIFMFDDRIEIINPGKLTNSLTVEKIKKGLSIHRNPVLNSIAKNILHYSGRGSGIKRILSINPNIEFINDIEKEEFKSIIPLKNIRGVNQINGGVNKKNGGVNKKNGGVNKELGGVNKKNGGVNKDISSVQDLLNAIINEPGQNANKLAKVHQNSLRTIERTLKKLKLENKIEFRGSPKIGGYYAKITE